MQAVTTKRVGTANVLEIAFTSQDPTKAANIANQFAQSYLDDQLQADADAAGRAGGFLNSRLSALAAQAQSDADAVAKYTVEHNLLSTTDATLPEQEITTKISTSRSPPSRRTPPRTRRTCGRPASKSPTGPTARTSAKRSILRWSGLFAAASVRR